MTRLLSSSIFLVAHVTAAAAAAAYSFNIARDYDRFTPLTKGFNWESCLEIFECSRFDVPLSWSNSTAGKATLAVLRYPAIKQPKLGTLFVNPGGPGDSGINFVASRGGRLMESTGGQYDIISWDPRGVGVSKPSAECFKTVEEKEAFLRGTLVADGIEVRGNFTDKSDLDEFYAQLNEMDAKIAELGQRCISNSPDIFQYLGTAAVVRDMLAMHDLLEGRETPLNYWGFSYGTVIGSYFVNMFPDRVGRIVIDGVVDPVMWANRPPHESPAREYESADEAFTGFASACAAAGPTGCSIAIGNSTADSIIQWTRDLLDAAHDYRKNAGPTAVPNSISAVIRKEVFDAMYLPIDWPALAEKLSAYGADLFNASAASNSTAQKRLLSTQLFNFNRRQANQTTNTTSGAPAPNDAILAVRCADAIDAGDVTTKDVFDFIVNATRTVSPMFSPMWVNSGYYCHHWPIRAVERYVGPWNNTLSNPILVIGNEADPVTPYISAKSVADALGDSAILIEQDDYGHASLAMRSDCTLAALQDYFLQNKLPTQDKFCGTNQVLFPGPGVTKKTLNQLASNGDNILSTTGSTDLENDLQAAKQRGQKLFIAVVALAAASGLLLVSLIVSCMRGHRKALVQSAYIPRGAFEKDGAGEQQGHTYNNPFIQASESKAGGYSRVES